MQIFIYDIYQLPERISSSIETQRSFCWGTSIARGLSTPLSSEPMEYDEEAYDETNMWLDELIMLYRRSPEGNDNGEPISLFPISSSEANDRGPLKPQ
mmetsp:Transcript_14179/g.30685  ORF Transcript_14179/g.30685 Transcript_14179/m.30685 type:complete len:98 (-) Transcript_14179:2213-2506(-)